MNRLIVFLGFVMMATYAVSIGNGQDFRVENSITMNNRTANNLTVVRERRVYDFMQPNGEITILDPVGEEFVLLDPTLRLQTVISFREVKLQADELLKSFEISESPFLNFIARPVFDEKAFEQESGFMVFRSLWMDYEFSTLRFDDEAVADMYYNYSYWMSQLNAVISPTAASALVRAELNQTLKKNKRFPEKVTVKLYPKGKNVLSSTTIQADSIHNISKRLQDSDLQRVTQTEQYRQSFTLLPFMDYQKEVKKKQ